MQKQPRFLRRRIVKKPKTTSLAVWGKNPEKGSSASSSISQHSCGVFLDTPPQLLVDSSHLNPFEGFLDAAVELAAKKTTVTRQIIVSLRALNLNPFARTLISLKFTTNKLTEEIIETYAVPVGIRVGCDGSRLNRLSMVYCP